MLLLCALLLAAIAHSEGRAGGREALRWRGLSAIFLLMSVDEAVQTHEQTIDPLRSVWKRRWEGWILLAGRRNFGDQMIQTLSGPVSCLTIVGDH